MSRKLTEDNGVLATKELTEKYQCSYSTIERFCKSHGFKSKRKPIYQTKAKYQYLTDHLEEFLMDWEDHVLTEDKLIEKYHAPMTAMHSQAALYGKRRKPIEEQIDIDGLIADYKDNTMSQCEIHEKYGISQTTKLNILRKNNAEISPVGTRNRKYYFNEYYLDEIDSEEKAYFLGFVYADGSHNIDRHELRINISKDDDDLLKMFYELFECDKEIKYIHNKQYNKDYAMFAVQSNHFSDQLLKLGVMANKSFKVTFPSFLSEDLIRHFIRGYFDGDGCIGLSQRGWKSTSVQLAGNQSFLSSIKEIIYKDTEKSMKLYKHTNSNIFSLQSGGVFNVYAILNYLYKDSNIYLQRKYQRYLDFITKYEEEYLNNE